MDNNKIGSLIADLRKGNGMTQVELAGFLNVSNKTVSKWERGDGYPDVTVISKIAEIFNITSDELLCGKRKDNAVDLTGTQPKRHKGKIAIKMLKAAFYSFSILPLLVTAILMPFYPEFIPGHYDAAGEITRWGSKFESFVFPAMIVAFGVLMIFLVRFLTSNYEKREETAKHVVLLEIILWVVFLSAQLVFNILHYWLMVRNYSISVSGMLECNKFQVVALGIGVFLVIIGAVFPFVPKNSIFGIRTSTSMESKETWRITHLWGGLTLFISGIIAVVFGSIFDKGIISLCITGGLFVLAFVIIIIEQAVLFKA